MPVKPPHNIPSNDPIKSELEDINEEHAIKQKVLTPNSSTTSLKLTRADQDTRYKFSPAQEGSDIESWVSFKCLNNIMSNLKFFSGRTQPSKQALSTLTVIWTNYTLKRA